MGNGKRSGVNHHSGNIVGGHQSTMVGKKKRRNRRGGGFGATGSLGITGARTFHFFPSKPASGENTATWWLELLLTVAQIVMTLLMDKTKTQLGYGSDKVIGGSIAKIAMGPEDLLVGSPLSKTSVSATTSSASTTFRQGKVGRIRLKIIPQAELGKRGGILHACITPCTPDQVEDDFSSKSTEVSSVDELRNQPGAVSWSAAQSRTLNFRFKKGDPGLNWVEIGTQGTAIRKYQGGVPTFYVWLAYESSATSETASIKDNYTPSEAVFTVEVKGHVRLKDSEQNVAIRAMPLFLTTPAKVGWEREGMKYKTSHAVMNPQTGLFSQFVPPCDEMGRLGVESLPDSPM